MASQDASGTNSPAHRHQSLLATLRRLELGGAGESDRERSRASLRTNRARLREVPFFEKRSAEDAQKVMSGEVRLSNGASVRLGELDVENASKLAMALDVNEVVCVELIVASIENGANAEDVGPAAVGIYLRERAAALESLLVVLRCADGTSPVDAVMDGELVDYAEELLKDGTLFDRLVKLVTAPPPGGPFLVASKQNELALAHGAPPVAEQRALGPLDKLVDIRGRPILRQECVAQERRLVVECLFHAARVMPPSTANAQELLVLAGKSAEAMKNIDGVAPEDLPMGYGSIFAAAAAFTPVLSGVDAAVVKTELAKATSTTVNSANAPPLFSFIRFAWCVLALDLGLTEAEEGIKESLKNDALEAIAKVLKTGAFQDDHPVARKQNLEMVHAILTRYLHHNLRKTALHRMLTDGTGVKPPVVENGMTIETDPAKPMADLCALLAEIYRQAPELSAKCSSLKSFLEIAGDGEHSVGSLVKLLELCTTIAQTSEGARSIFELLQRSQGAANWDRLLGALIGYVQRFMSSPEDLIDAGEEYDPYEGEPEMNEADAEGLQAYLAVFKAVMENAEKSDALHWLMWLEHRIGAALMDALLQLYVNPVPLTLKAALLDAISALCWDPNVASDVWQLLDQANVLPNPMQTGMLQSMSTQRSDVSYIYSLVEPQEQAYTSTAGWLRLTCRLLVVSKEGNCGPSSDGATPAWYHCRFIRERIFGELVSRVHKDQTERWMMTRDCIDHFLFVLHLYQETLSSDVARDEIEMLIPSTSDTLALEYGGGQSNALALRGASGSHHALDKPGVPGLELLIDFLTSGKTFNIVMNILSIGTEALSFERHTQHGAALEDCVLGALQMIEYILSIDEHAVAKLREKNKDAIFYKTLDEILTNDMHQLANVLGYVQYKFNPAIPLTALKITQVLCRRVKHIVMLLPSASRAAIIEGCASCLELAFATVPPSGDDDDDVVSSLDPNVANVIDCATTVFQLLHENLGQDGTNFAHLLLGFDLTGASNEIELAPFTEFNCLSVLLELLEAAPPSMHATAVLPYTAPEMAAELLFKLASSSSTSMPTVALMGHWPPHAPTFALAELLADALHTELPSASLKRRSVMHHRASILRLCAIVLDVQASKSVTPQSAPKVVLDIMSTILDNGREGSNAQPQDSAIEHGQFAVLELPKSVTHISERCSEHFVRQSFTPEVEQARDEISAQQLLDDSRNVSEGGIYATNSHGDKIIDADVVKQKLCAECKRLESEQHVHAMRAEAVAFIRTRHNLGVDATMKIVVAKNTVVEDATARSELFKAWERLVTVAVTRGLASFVAYFDLQSTSAPGHVIDDTPMSPHSILFELVDGILSGLCEAEPFGGGSDAAKVAPFCRLVHMILSQLRILGDRDRSKGKVSEMLAPSKCRALLRSLNACLLHRSPVPQASRLDIIGALLQYLAYCRPDADGLSPVTKRGQSMADLSFSHTMDVDIEKGNAAIIQRDATALVDVISRDALEGSNDTKAITLAALEAMVAVCAGTGVGGIEVLLLQNGVAMACLHGLETVSMPDLVMNTPRAASQSKAIEASLSLLLRMAQSEPAQMIALGTIVALTNCRAIDAYADIHSSSAATATMQADLPYSELPIPRARHHKLLVNVLRLVGSLLAASPSTAPVPAPSPSAVYQGAIVQSAGIPEVTAQTFAFVEAHYAVIHRVLADRATRPHLADLAELDATVNLVTRLLKGPILPDPKLRLQGALDVLTVTICSENNKYSKYIKTTLGHCSADDDMVLAGSNDVYAVAAADRIYQRYVNVRSMILSAQRVMVNKGLTAFTFEASDGIIGDERPTIHMFATMVLTLALELARAAEARKNALKDIEYCKILRSLNMNENDLLAKAAAIEGDIRTLVISVENVLEVLYAHLQPSAQHGDDDSIVAPSGELNTGKRSQELGLLASFMVPALQSLVEMDKPTLGLETEFLSMIATRVRDAIAAQPNAMSRSRFGIA